MLKTNLVLRFIEDKKFNKAEINCLKALELCLKLKNYTLYQYNQSTLGLIYYYQNNQMLSNLTYLDSKLNLPINLSQIYNDLPKYNILNHH